MSFSKDFIWGAATASYQVEGAAYEDGKGLSTWDVFCRKPDAIYQGHTGDVACDHYHRYREDVALMRQIGLKGYRFSISWSRVLPEGIGKINAKGLAFYDKLVDALLEANIIPLVTLFHWDYPYDLFLRGGWLNPDSSDWFAEYTRAVVDKLSDRVKYWMTFNEPGVVIKFGHKTGDMAPGLKLEMGELLRALHNLLLSHGKAVGTIRERAKTAPQIGWAWASTPVLPKSNTPADIEAARKDTFQPRREIYTNTLFLDTIFFGHYSEADQKCYGKDMPKVPDSDLKIIAQPLDFFGVNLYHGAQHFIPGTDWQRHPYPVEQAYTANKYPVTPDVFYWGPRFFWERYRKPILITENGAVGEDWVALDGKVHDPQRIDFTHRYLRELHKAHAEGIPVLGYMHWSFMDNFEWTLGYRERLGLVYVNFSNQQRILKDSACWYHDVIASNGNSLLTGKTNIAKG